MIENEEAETDGVASLIEDLHFLVVDLSSLGPIDISTIIGLCKIPIAIAWRVRVTIK